MSYSDGLYKYVIEIGESRIILDDAVERVLTNPEQSVISDVIMQMIPKFGLKVENVFAETVVGTYFGTYNQNELMKYNNTGVFKLATAAYQCEGKKATDDFNRIFFKEILKWVATPRVVFVVETGQYRHISELDCFDRAIQDIRDLSLPLSRYAASGFVNLVKSCLCEVDGVNIKYDNAQFPDAPRKQFVDDGGTDLLSEFLDRFITRFNFFDKPTCQEYVLSEIKLLCDKQQNARDFFLSFYEKHTEIFDKLFVNYPEYIFIVQGIYQRYEVIMNLSEKLELTMQDFAREEKFFSLRNSNHSESIKVDFAVTDVPIGDCSNQASRYAFDIKMHQVKLIKAFDRFTQKLISKGIDYQIINFWPNATLEKKAVRPVGPYIAIAFERDGRWALLIDGIYDRCAIYYWEGPSLEEGLNIFKISKSYARSQENVKHYNHRGTIENYDTTYDRIVF